MKRGRSIFVKSAPVIYPDPPRGGYNPPVFMRHPPPNHLKFKGVIRGVFTGGVYVIVMEWVINVVKY